ncbi:MAG: diacylglycerol kinase family protein [Armatimonadota bacterium]
MQRGYLVVNPSAGGGRATQRLRAVRTALEEWRTVCTQSLEDGIRVAKQIAKEGAVCVAVGGDGTLSSVVGGYLRAVEAGEVADTTRIACLPVGTANDAARELGVPKRLQKVLSGLARPTCQTLDAGCIRLPDGSEHYFFNVVGVGFDARVNDATSEHLKRRWGRLAYIVAILKQLWHYQPVHLQLEIDGQRIEQSALLVAIANGRSYGGGIRIAPFAEFDDGCFDVCLIEYIPRLEFLRQFPKALRGEHLGHPAVHSWRARSVRLWLPTVEPVSVDGELLYTSHLHCEVLPARVPFALPQV